MLITNMKKKITIFQIVFLLSIFSAGAHAGEFVDKLSFGIGYPYLGIKCDLTEEISVEARGAFDKGVQIYGARGYYNFNPSSQLIPFAGLELDYVLFNSDDIEGSGFIAYPFLGGEYYLANNISLIMDFGPAFINLEEDEFELTVDGFEWVVNFGVYYYFR